MSRPLALVLGGGGARGLELKMASTAAHGVLVRRILLRDATPVPLWDFSRTNELIQQGYEIARQALSHWRPELLLQRQMSLGARLESKGYSAPAMERY